MEKQQQSVAKRLREVGIERYGTLAEFARTLEMKAQSLNDYLSGKSLPGNKLQARLRDLNFDVEFIMTGKKRLGESMDKFGQAMFPIVSHIRCGSGTINPYEVHSRKTLEGPSNPKYKGALFFEVKGTSMEPRWEEGDFVLVHPKMKPRNGDYGVVCWDQEEGALKKIYFKDGKLILQSINPAFHAIFIDPPSVWFIGRVLWTKHKDS
ncbi:MAG: LexA family protein [Bacteroidota bacterium]